MLQNYGANAWRIHNFLLEAAAKQTENALEDLKQLTVEVNRERKNNQAGLEFAPRVYVVDLGIIRITWESNSRLWKRDGQN